MKNSENKSELRDRTEKIFQHKNETESSEKLSPDTHKLIQELQIHQIELEIQNEDLITTQRTLEESQRKYRDLYNFAPVGYFTLTEEGIINDLNLTGAGFLGKNKNDLIKKTIIQFMTPESRKVFYRHFKKAKTSGMKENCEIDLIKKDNSIITVSLETIYSKINSDDSGDFKTVIIDVSERKKIQDMMQISEKRYQGLFQYAPISIWEEDLSKLKSHIMHLKSVEGHNLEKFLDNNPDELKKCIKLMEVIDVNQNTVELYRAPSKEAFLNGLEKIFVEDSLDAYKEAIISVSEGKIRFYGELLNKTFEGDEINIIVNYIVPPGFEETFSRVLVAILDITYLKAIETQLKAALDDKELLLKETHHRVKNNLQVISSLLNLQSGYIKNKADLEIFQDAQSRAKSMALIHERLYQAEDLKRINFSDYTRKLCNGLIRTYNKDSSQIKLKISSQEFMVDVNIAVPMGLIINEIVSNSLKHAFQSQNGQIEVNMEKKEHQYLFKISDNGIGIKKEIDLDNMDSLGMKIIYSLVNQIDGTIELLREPGTTFIIKFEEES